MPGTRACRDSTGGVRATSAPFSVWLSNHQQRLVQWVQRWDSACTIRPQVANLGARRVAADWELGGGSTP